MHTQLSLYDYVSSITVPIGRYIAGLFFLKGKIPRDSRNDNSLWKTISTSLFWGLLFLLFYCPNAGNGFEDKYFYAERQGRK